MNEERNPDPTRLIARFRSGQHKSGDEVVPSGVASGRPQSIDYWRALAFRKWAILLAGAAVALVAWLIVREITPVYRATSTVLVEASSAKVVSIEGVYSGINASREYFQTQAENVRSREILLRVARELDLVKLGEFNPRYRKVPLWESLISRYLPVVAEWLQFPEVPVSDEAAEAVVVRRMSEHLRVELVRMSQLLHISFDARDPVLAARIANAIAESFIQADLQARTTITRTAGQALNERLADQQAKLDAAERALQTYREREGLPDSKTSDLSGAGRQLDELIQKLVDARVRRSEAEEAVNLVRAARTGSYDAVPAVMRSAAVQRAREQETEAERNLAEVSHRFGVAHPKYAAAAADLKSARENTQKQIQTVIASTEKEYTAARATEQTLEEAIALARTRIQSMNRKEIELRALEREAITNRQLYQTLLSRYKETAATTELQMPSARVMETAVPPPRPVRPAKLLIVSASAAVGLFLAAFVALVLERIDNKVRTVEDVEGMLGQPLLAALPVVRGKHRSAMATLVMDDPGSSYAEAIRTAGIALRLHAANASPMVVVVTSSVPDEGKSTFSMNLALWQAQTARVLLIEGDLRRPSIPKVLQVPADQKGLSDLLVGSATVAECVIASDRTPLHLMTCGTAPTNALEILMSSRLRDTLMVLRDTYDLIVVNTPPVQLVADALVVAAHATAALYVVKANDTPLPLAAKGLKRLGETGVPIAGVVLNQHDFVKAGRYFGEYSGFDRLDDYGGYGGYGRSRANA